MLRLKFSEKFFITISARVTGVFGVYMNRQKICYTSVLYIEIIGNLLLIYKEIFLDAFRFDFIDEINSIYSYCCCAVLIELNKS